MPEQLPITTYGMEILRKKTETIKDIEINLIRLVENMFYTMINAEGSGLAAPQVNKNISLCVIDVSHIDDYRREKPLTLINPVILDKHGENIDKEGCLSIPELQFTVTRSNEILVKYNDFNMNEITREFSGYFARVVQHETDHLNGVLSIDYLQENEKKEIAVLLRRIKKNKVHARYPLFYESVNL
jgi:peptide deformylase